MLTEGARGRGREQGAQRERECVCVYREGGRQRGI